MQRRKRVPDALCGEESAALAFDWVLDDMAPNSADCTVAWMQAAGGTAWAFLGHLRVVRYHRENAAMLRYAGDGHAAVRGGGRQQTEPGILMNVRWYVSARSGGWWRRCVTWSERRGCGGTRAKIWGDAGR